MLYYLVSMLHVQCGGNRLIKQHSNCFSSSVLFNISAYSFFRQTLDLQSKLVLEEKPGLFVGLQNMWHQKLS